MTIRQAIGTLVFGGLVAVLVHGDVLAQDATLQIYRFNLAINGAQVGTFEVPQSARPILVSTPGVNGGSPILKVRMSVEGGGVAVLTVPGGSVIQSK